MTPPRRTETLEAMIGRLTRDAQAVAAPMTPEIMADAIRSAGWTHKSAPHRRLAIVIAGHWGSHPAALATVIGAMGWTRPRAAITNDQARRGILTP